MPKLSVLYITYNRSELLQESLYSLKKAIEDTELDCEFVLSDDASTDQHKNILQTLGFDVVSIASQNAGLGANCNRGLGSCSGDYIMQLQDDWLYNAGAREIIAALEIFQLQPKVGIIQFNQTGSDLPRHRISSPHGFNFDLLANDHLPWGRRCSIRPYSDQPHIKRREFVADIGGYMEGVPMEVMENDYKKRVANQSKWHVAQLVQSEPIFRHLGEQKSFRKNSGTAARRGLAGSGLQFGRTPIRRIAIFFDHLASLARYFSLFWTRALVGKLRVKLIGRDFE